MSKLDVFIKPTSRLCLLRHTKAIVLPASSQFVYLPFLLVRGKLIQLSQKKSLCYLYIDTWSQWKNISNDKIIKTLFLNILIKINEPWLCAHFSFSAAIVQHNLVVSLDCDCRPRHPGSILGYTIVFSGSIESRTGSTHPLGVKWVE